MKQAKFPNNQEPDGAAPRTGTADLNQKEASTKPSADEVAKSAYLRYVNQGSLDGHDKQHWLEAEAELVAERNLARVYIFS
ncbi:MAG TPA: DUF2934 domain-containing protein [Verrucomicrobiae bacterium]|nr:DUF2934 domain-containing protein [Verrucomicrobiae bacterium]